MLPNIGSNVSGQLLLQVRVEDAADCKHGLIIFCILFSL